MYSEYKKLDQTIELERDEVILSVGSESLDMEPGPGVECLGEYVCADDARQYTGPCMHRPMSSMIPYIKRERSQLSRRQNRDGRKEYQERVRPVT